MATISVPNVRVSSDIRFKVTLSDNDVAVDWSSVEELAVILYFRDQRTFGARCTIDDIDGTDLHISYPADRPQFLGIADIVVNCVYQGFEKTFDKPAVNFVDSTAAASGVTNVDEVELEVDIAVADVDTSILDGAIYAAVKAAMAARNLPYPGENGNWWLFDPDAEEYVDSGVEAQGPAGPPGQVTEESIVNALGYIPANAQDIPDVSGKADKVSNPTSGNLAGLDANGNLTDSGHKHSDYSLAPLIVNNETTTIEEIAAAAAVNRPMYLGVGNQEASIVFIPYIGHDTEYGYIFSLVDFESGGQVIFYCSDEGEWGTQVFPLPSSLSDLGDVDDTTPIDGQALVWNDSDSKWKPGAAGTPDAVKYVSQSLTSEQQAQARTNIGAGTYSKPSNGIPAADLANGVIPDVSGKEDSSNKVSTITGNESDTTKFPNMKALADAIGKWGVVSQTQTWSGSGSNPRTYVMGNLVYGLIPKADIDLYEAAGALFNEHTGYFELNGLTDISYEEMKAIYYGSISAVCVRDRLLCFVQSPNRTTVWLYATGSFPVNLQYMCYGAYLETIGLNPMSKFYLSTSSQTTGAFRGAGNLRKIIGAIKITATSIEANMFNNCFSLEDVSIEGLVASISFEWSPNLTLATVAYLVNKAANTSAITITLHPTAYARCQADTTEYTYSGQTYTGILAYASAKNITIASA